MKKILIMAVFVLLYVVLAQAGISSQRAVNFVSVENNFLFSGERAELFPNVQIKNSNTNYWVVAVVSGTSVSAFIPLRGSTDPEIPAAESENRRLIRTAFILRNYQDLKQKLLQQNEWIFGTNTASDLRGIATSQLRDERFDLQTARVTLNEYPLIQSAIDVVEDDVSVLSTTLESLAGKIRGLRDSEAAYFRSPDTNSLDGLKSRFEETVALSTSAREQLSTYLSDLDVVQQSVAQTELSINDKTSLQNILAPPNQPVRLQRIIDVARTGEFFLEELQKIFDNATIQRENLLGNLKTRMEKNNAYKSLFGSNEELIEKTNGVYASVREGVVDIFSEEKQAFWKEQNELTKLRESWRRAESYYTIGNYRLAQQNGDAARRSILRIYSRGFIEIEEQPNQSLDVLINGIIILVIILIGVYAARNRKKLFALVSEPLGDDGYE